MSTWVVATCGTGLYCREIFSNSTTVYADREVTAFSTYEEAVLFIEENNDDYYDVYEDDYYEEEEDDYEEE
jgi:hypothetical protein